MRKQEAKKKRSLFENISLSVPNATGSSYAFIIAFSLVLIWAICGSFFDFSESGEMLINTGTTTITILLVILIQKSQYKYSLSIQLKLNELVAAHKFASNRLIDVENMTEDEMKIIQIAKAWFIDGKDDVDISLIKIVSQSAYYWDNKNNNRKKR